MGLNRGRFAWHNRGKPVISKVVIALTIDIAWLRLYFIDTDMITKRAKPQLKGIDGVCC